MISNEGTTARTLVCVDCDVVFSLRDLDYRSHTTTAVFALCADCGFYCENCENLRRPDDCDLTDGDGDTTCGYCVERYGLVRCEDCETIVEDYTDVEGRDVCDTCVHHGDYFFCSHCEEYNRGEAEAEIVLGNFFSTRVEAYCGACAAQHLMMCERCDDYMLPENAWESYGDFYCESCYDDREEDEDDCEGVAAWNRELEPVFHGEGPAFFGVEIEMEATQGRRELVSRLLGGATADTLMLKEDGSLSHEGVELVSHPYSLAAWREVAPLTPALTAANGYAVAWDAPSAGMHVHVSRAAFLTPAALYRFAHLFRANEADVTELAGRSSDRWAPFNAVPSGKDLTWCAKGGRPSNRYAAVNLTNAATVEIRVFRSTLSAERVLKNVSFVAAATEYANVTPTSDWVRGAFTWARFTEWAKAEGYEFAL